jgi:putative endonuclease
MKQDTSKRWYVYIVVCCDNTFYTGITLDPRQRITQHNSGTGSKYIITKKRPVKLVYVEEVVSRSMASQREYAIKQLTKVKKSQLLDSGVNQVKKWL